MIVHVDTARDWRGGQNQVYLLHRELHRSGVPSVVCAPRPSPLFQRCSAESLPAIALPRFGSASILAPRIARVLAQCTILHAHDSGAATVAATAVRRWPKIAVVLHRRISFRLAPGHPQRWKYRLARHWIAVSQQIADQLKSVGVDRSRISIVPSAIDIDALEENSRMSDIDALRSALEIPSNSVVLTTIGALATHKAHDVAIKALETVRTNRPDVVLVIAGEGNSRPQLQRLARQRGLTRAVRFAGFRDDVSGILKLSSMHLAPSTDGEGSPAAVKEAMLLGTPVVASDIEAHRSIVGDCAVLVPRQDTLSLAQAILSLLEHPAQGDRLARLACDAARRFAPSTLARQTLEVYRRVQLGSKVSA